VSGTIEGTVQLLLVDVTFADKKDIVRWSVHIKMPHVTSVEKWGIVKRIAHKEVLGRIKVRDLLYIVSNSLLQ
jgi:hypothetical protein